MNRTVAALATALAVVVVITGCSQPTPQVNVSTGAQTTGVSVSGTGSSENFGTVQILHRRARAVNSTKVMEKFLLKHRAFCAVIVP